MKKKKSLKSKKRQKLGDFSDQVLQVEENIIWRSIDKEVVSILRIDDSSLYQLELFAKQFWLFIDGKKTVLQLQKKVEKLAGVEVGAYQKEIGRLVQFLLKEKLARIR